MELINTHTRKYNVPSTTYRHTEHTIMATITVVLRNTSTKSNEMNYTINYLRFSD